jgi:hypothetical protein
MRIIRNTLLLVKKKKNSKKRKRMSFRRIGYMKIKKTWNILESLLIKSAGIPTCTQKSNAIY